MATNAALTGLASDLWKGSETGDSIRNVLIGSGQMGAESAARAGRMFGIVDSATAGVRVDCASNGMDSAGQVTGDRGPQIPQTHTMRQWNKANICR